MKVSQPQTGERERAMITNVDRALNSDAFCLPGTASELHFELALWVRGLESFCSVGQQAFPGERSSLAGPRNYRNEFHITNAVLIKCGELIEELGRYAELNDQPLDGDVRGFSELIGTLIVSNGAFIRNQSLDFAEWRAWCEIVVQRIAQCELYAAFDSEFEAQGLAYLPKPLFQSIESQVFDRADNEDLQRSLPVLGGVLRSLDVVRRMLASDAPLKPALAIFAFVYEAVNELIFEIGERLSRREDETGEIFAMLDATTYTLAIESKKVYSHELASVIGTRSATLVFARIESAFGLLNDNIRHLLAGFTRLTEPGADATIIFPEFSEKLEQSMKLRSSLWTVMSAVRTAEADATEEEMDNLRPQLESFLRSRISFLFYKDRETFERFCNEIMISPSGPDARPILHRFSAYVETLFNQVGMRVVLANHPFTPD